VAVPPQPHDAWIRHNPQSDGNNNIEPGSTNTAPRYRSLKDLSRGQAARSVLGASATDEAVLDDDESLGTGSDAPQRPTLPTPSSSRQNRNQRRIWIGVAAAASLVVLGALVWGGLQLYKVINPDFGRNYITGGQTTVGGVEFTVTDLECGRDSAPDMAGAPDEGQFCVVWLEAHNTSDSQRYVSLDLITAYLDNARQVTPDVNAMLTLFGALEADASAEYVVVYDIASNARLEELTILLGTEFGTIDVSD